MKYIPNQKARSIRLQPEHIELVSKALSQHAARLSLTNPPEARLARIMIRALPIAMPYTLYCFAQEWGILSRALRPQGSTPIAGTDEARMFALYTKLRRVMVFITEGDAARLRAAKRRGYRRLGTMSAGCPHCGSPDPENVHTARCPTLKR